MCERKPVRTIPLARASSTAKDDGAETEAIAGIPAIRAFWAISNEALPLTKRRHWGSGSRLARQHLPNDFVHRIVTSHIFVHDEQIAVGFEQCGGMKSSGLVEGCLYRVQLVGQLLQKARGDAEAGVERLCL